jgi:hypothetical protein
MRGERSNMLPPLNADQELTMAYPALFCNAPVAASPCTHSFSFMAVDLPSEGVATSHSRVSHALHRPIRRYQCASY